MWFLLGIFFLLRTASRIIEPISSRPAVQQSGKGGTAVLPTVNITAPGGEFGTIPVGAPYFGHDLNDTNICTVFF